MENINLGKYSVAKSWDDVTLLQWQNYMRKVGEKEDNKVDVIDTIVAFSDIPKEILMQCPTDLFEAIVGHLKWLNEDFQREATDKVKINGETYLINIMEKLKVKEYLDVNTVIQADKYNYAMMFAILCRKPNEIYDDEFIAEKLPQRIKMYEQAPLSEVFGLISFFLLSYLEYENNFRNFSMVQEMHKEVEELVKNTRTLLRHMPFITLLHPQQIIRLRKLEKSLKNIS